MRAAVKELLRSCCSNTSCEVGYKVRENENIYLVSYVGAEKQLISTMCYNGKMLFEELQNFYERDEITDVLQCSVFDTENGDLYMLTRRDVHNLVCKNEKFYVACKVK